MIVDTPGYGYMFAPLHLQQKWRKMLFKYLGFGVRINMIVLCVNAHLGLKKLDLQMLEDLQHLKKPVQVVLTKLDKIKYDADIVRVVTDTTSQLQRFNKFVYPMVHLTSAHHLFGIQDLRAKFAIGFEDQLKV